VSLAALAAKSTDWPATPGTLGYRVPWNRATRDTLVDLMPGEFVDRFEFRGRLVDEHDRPLPGVLGAATYSEATDEHFAIVHLDPVEKRKCLPLRGGVWFAHGSAAVSYGAVRRSSPPPERRCLAARDPMRGLVAAQPVPMPSHPRTRSPARRRLRTGSPSSWPSAASSPR
jgi:hypothetical protein